MKRNTIRAILPLLLLGLCAAFVFSVQPAAQAQGTAANSLLDAESMFTERDLEQSADLSAALSLTVSDGQTVTITEAGVYVLSGTASEASVIVEAPEDAKVQLVLNGLSITNSHTPCLYVKSADKVFVTLAGDSAFSVTGSFTADGETNTDGVIFSRADLTLNGGATLRIASTANGIVCKDNLKLTGGSYVISASRHALEGKDSIRIAGGSFTLNAGEDGLHAENSEDAAKGSIYISGGSFEISAGDDGLHAESAVQIDGGTLNIRAKEGVESTYVQLNGGSITIQATDDGVNAAQKSSAYRATVEITGGELTVSMGAGDTDGIDSNGNLIISGGTVSVSGNSSFDVDGSISFTGGSVYINGQSVSSIPNQMMGGGMGAMGNAGMNGMGAMGNGGMNGMDSGGKGRHG